jgi:hypothetical protein
MSARIERLREVGGIAWVSCLRAPAIRALADERAAFELLSEPTPLQVRALELTGVSPSSM